MFVPKKIHRVAVLLSLIVSLVALGCSSLYVKGPKDSWVDVVNHVKPATVKIYIGDLDMVTEEPVIVGSGSGFIVREDGIIVTAAHVAQITDKLWRPWILVTLCDDTEYLAPLETVRVFPKHDIAILQIKAKDLPVLEFEEDPLVKGESVMVMGSSSVSNWAVTDGIVSNIDTGYYKDTHYGFIQMTATVNPGYSGGPVVNVKGKVVGVSIAIALKQNETYIATLGSIVQELVNSLIS